MKDVDVDTGSSTVDVVYDDATTDVDEMTRALTSGGFSVNDVIYPNRPPTSDAGPDQTVKELETVTLNGNGSSDPDNDTLSYAWRQVRGPDVSLDTPNNVTAVFEAPAVSAEGATLIFNLTVIDAEDERVMDDVKVFVENVLPVHREISFRDALALTETEDDLIIVDVRNQDAYCAGFILNAVNYSWDDGGFDANYHRLPVSAPILVVSQNGEKSHLATRMLDEMEYTSVYDLEGGMNAWTGSVETCGNDTPEPEPPVADAGADQTVFEGDTVLLDAAGSFDPYATITSYSWTLEGDPMVTLSDAFAAAPSFVAPMVDDSPLTLTFNLQVISESGLEGTDAVMITVQKKSTPDTPDDTVPDDNGSGDNGSDNGGSDDSTDNNGSGNTDTTEDGGGGSSSGCFIGTVLGH